MTFDARAAKLLQPGKHLIMPEHPGLRLIASVKRRSWVYRYKSPVDAAMRRVKLGEWPAMSYAAAVVEWEKRRGERDSGVDHSLQKRSTRREANAAAAAESGKGVYTVRDLLLDYLEGHIDVRRKPKGRAEVRRLLLLQSKPIAVRPAALIMRSEAYDLLQGLNDRPTLMGQVRQEMGAAWDYGLDSGRLPESTPNWWRLIMRGKMPRSKGKRIDGEHVGATKRVLSEQELGRLINWLPNFSRTVADALTLYLWTGTRGGEIVQMERSELADEAGVLWWTLPKEKTKNARHALASDLRVPLLGRAARVVRGRLLVADRFLFRAEGNEDKSIDQKTVQGGVYYHQPYCRTSSTRERPRLPVTRWSPHDLRRSVRTLLAAMGCPHDVAEAVLGHMQHGIVGVYNRHQYDAERLDWLTRLDARLDQLALQHAAAS